VFDKLFRLSAPEGTRMTRIYISVLFALTLFITAGQAKAEFTLTKLTVTQTVPGNFGTDLMAIVCPAGTKVISGGWSTEALDGRFLMVWVSRQVANSWRIMTVNTHPVVNLRITGHAVCASGVSGLGSYSAPLGPVNVGGNAGNGANAFCPNGGIPTGGGFDSNFPNPAFLVPTQSRPDYGNTWYSSEYNSTGQAKSFTAYVTCMTGVSGWVTPRFGNWVSFRGQASDMTSVDCLAGEFAVGGGFVTGISTSSPSTTTQLVRTFVSAPSPTIRVRWFARAFNVNEWDWAHLQPVVQCLHLN
jgi:hypothetical protein